MKKTFTISVAKSYDIDLDLPEEDIELLNADWRLSESEYDRLEEIKAEIYLKTHFSSDDITMSMLRIEDADTKEEIYEGEWWEYLG